MEATFRIPVNALPNIVKSIKSLFGSTVMIDITVKESEQNKDIDYTEMFKRTEQARLKNEAIIVPEGLDLSALANEVNL
ncbi:MULTISPECIES: hypothetical protein [unclassified Arcicella]|uniref:hypothetical protein n=1 Tax=unclassified Arcicella TaxID=2644986 RepID=UPI00285DBFA4|nr:MULTISPECIES: hypothetical protein [unclassified Arcicella]MDR6564575.1 putative dinucleotide-binding enzyme [Arcicella sp. BE51]MDR6825715.1 putative dinucleotide-binding enzyme [Arcicella sp. BE139]